MWYTAIVNGIDVKNRQFPLICNILKKVAPLGTLFALSLSLSLSLF
jgi:hypothetical protein